MFSAVISAFLIDIQAELKPDYAQQTTDLLIVLIQDIRNVDSSTSNRDFLPVNWSPDPAIVTVQVILYVSLASSLLAAFLAVLGKQ